ncbi:MAG: hypothetical protein CMJ75_14120 [Planctomycetaceae bacterium]|nr:hypothetical protein [Planctomycetaceae bacterium]
MIFRAPLAAVFLLTTGTTQFAFWYAGALCGAIAMGTVVFLYGWKMTRGTTLTGVWLWALFSFLSVAGVELALLWNNWTEPTSFNEALRYLAAVTTFCPLMAQLGAKRPQVQVWPLVVISLWVVLCLPAGEFLLLKQGALMEISAARSWFLVVLALVGLCNNLPNRFWPSVLLLVGAQTLLLSPHLPFSADLLDLNHSVHWALFLISGALLLHVLGWPTQRVCSESDRLWFDFRDHYGTLWALRLAQRVNEDQQHGGTILGWSGFRSRPPERDIEVDLNDPSVRQFRSLLARFVSAQWLARRVAESREATPW